MSSLKDYLLTDGVRQVLKEGGAAVPDVTRINQLNAASTVADVYSRLLYPIGIDNTQYALLGSTGKRDPVKNGTPEGSSGDIDLAVQGTRDSVFTRVQEICKRDGLQCKLLTGLGILSVRFPITNTDGKQADKFVQVDLMVVPDVSYCEWAYYSPSFDESPYKGLFRNEVLFALAKRCESEVLDKTDTGQATKWTRGKLDLSNGFYRMTKTNVGKAGRLNKTAKTLDSVFITRDPDTVVQTLFGDIGRTAADVKTFEQALDALQDPNFRFRDDLPGIIQDVSKGILDKKQAIPVVITKLFPNNQ